MLAFLFLMRANGRHLVPMRIRLSVGDKSALKGSAPVPASVSPRESALHRFAGN
jgi:hypothetical protein